MIRDVVTIFGVIAGFSYYVLIVRNSQRMQRMQLETRRSQIKLQFYNAFKPEFFSKLANIIFLQEFTTLREWLDKYGPSVDPEGYASTMSLIYTLNSLGMFLKDGDIDPHSFFQIWNPLGLKEVWHRLEPLIKEWREYYEYQELWESFEYLGNEARNLAPAVKEVLQ